MEIPHINKQFNVYAEAAMLGTVLIDGTLFHDLILQGKHFYEARHRVIYRAMKEIAEAVTKVRSKSPLFEKMS